MTTLTQTVLSWTERHGYEAARARLDRTEARIGANHPECVAARVALREDLVGCRREAVRFALEAVRATAPGSALRRFWEAELIDAERRLSCAEGMPAHAA